MTTLSLERSVYDYRHDVERLLRPLSYEPGSYNAALYNRDKYPVFPFTTRMGDVTIRLLGDEQAVAESDCMTIYGVDYRIFMHLKVENGCWVRETGVTGLQRIDRDYRRWDALTAPRKRFDAVALPAIAAFLDSAPIVSARRAARAIRLAWELDANLLSKLRDIDALISELQAAREAVAGRIGDTRAELFVLQLELTEDVA
jgi:hypothetical protein